MTTEKAVRLQQIEVRMGKLRRQMDANSRAIALAIRRGKQAPQNLCDDNDRCRDELAELGAEKQKLLGVGLIVR